MKKDKINRKLKSSWYEMGDYINKAMLRADTTKDAPLPQALGVFH
jgi:hypothetical protein